jgi:hypothetical protein
MCYQRLTRSRKSKKGKRIHWPQKRNKREQTAIYKTLHRKGLELCHIMLAMCDSWLIVSMTIVSCDNDMYFSSTLRRVSSLKMKTDMIQNELGIIICVTEIIIAVTCWYIHFKISTTKIVCSDLNYFKLLRKGEIWHVEILLKVKSQLSVEKKNQYKILKTCCHVKCLPQISFNLKACWHGQIFTSYSFQS